MRCVIQPQAVSDLATASWPSLTTTQLDEQCFRYEYDKKGRMIMKKVPGAGEVYMVYDGRDRLVMTQDGKMRLTNQWMVTKYDELNRPTETGLWINATSLSDHRTNADASIAYPVTSSNYDLLTQTYYDSYAWASALSSSLKDYNISYANSYLLTGTSFPFPQTVAKTDLVRGKVTGSKVKVLGSSTYLTTLSFYDDKGRVVQIRAENITGGIDVVTTQYSWTGQPLVTVQQHEKAGSPAQTSIVVTRITYDDLGRMFKVENKVSNTLVNSGAMPAFKTIVENTYDQLGQLKSKKLAPAFGSGTGLETANYEYNIRGWMLGMNRDYVRDASSSNWFGFDLGYDKADNNLVGGQTYANPQYNGNIEGMVWKSKSDGEKRKYDFTYDAANRLTGADFNQYTGSAFNKTAGVDFSVSNLIYDHNGNIASMTQKGLKAGSSSTIDQLTYSYYTGTNRLKAVTDAANDNTSLLGDFKYDATTKTSTDYTYDVNGNLDLDNNKKISSITYNHLNLPSVVTITGKGTITYTYDAAGNKLKKVTVDNTVSPAVTTTTLYAGGGVYENDVLQFLGHEEGRIRFKPAVGATPASLEYDYMLKDHLGNVRMVLTEETKTDMYPAATMEAAAATVEETYYSNLPATRASVPSNYGGSYPQKAAKVQGNTGNTDNIMVGPAMILKVMAGDQFNFTVNSWWDQAAKGMQNPANPYNELLGAIAGSISGVSGGHFTPTQLQSNTNLLGALTSFLNGQGYDNTKAKGYVNWILLDENFAYVSSNSGYEQIGASTVYTTHTRTSQPISKSGYLYIYVSNATPDKPVFFDNLQVSHIRGVMLEETHYYPFGLTMAGISSKALGFGSPKNKEKTFQAQRFDDEFGLDWIQFNWRTHDPQIGRFLQIDPLSEEYEYNSTYAFSENKVTTHVELEGLEAEWFERQVERDLNDINRKKITREQLEKRVNDRNNAGAAAYAIVSLVTPGPDEVIVLGALGAVVKVGTKAEKVKDIVQGVDKVDDKIDDVVKAEKNTGTTTKKDRVANQKPGEKAQNQLEGIEKKQAKEKKNAASQGEKQNKINSTKKSEQGLKKELKNIKSLKDAQDNF